MIYTSQLQVKTDVHHLETVLKWFDQFYQPSIPQFSWLACKTALAEAFINVVRHGHREQPADTLIQIDLAISETTLTIQVWDYGPGFDLVAVLGKEQQQTDPLATHGRGLAIMQQVADKLTYSRIENQRNCLLIEKYFNLE